MSGATSSGPGAAGAGEGAIPPVAQSVLDAIGDRQVILCAGPGGVGKTTSAAAIALAAAQAGKRVLVLTIDPARRLADALGVGLEEGDRTSAPKRIHEGLFTKAGLKIAGELSAMMLDAGRTMDDLVRRLSPSAGAAERLLDNAIYRHISRALAGALEYTAVEKLYDLRSRFDFDLIVVDTPPSKNVLDFVEAPEYMARFLDEKIIKWFQIIDPTQPADGITQGLLKRTTRVVWEVLSRVFGRVFLTDIVDFVGAIEMLADELRGRAQSIAELLRSKQALFFIVASTDELVMRDAAFLRREIARRGIPFGGFIINRVHVPSGLGDDVAVEAALIEAVPEGFDAEVVASVARKIVEVCQRVDADADADLKAVGELRDRTRWDGFLALLPRQVEEINDLMALHRLSSFFLPTSS